MVSLRKNLTIFGNANLLILEQGVSIRKGARENFLKKILKLDSHAESINFNYANGSTVYNTGLGAFLTIFVALLTFTYFCSNMNVMVTNKASRVVTSVTDSAFTYNDTITSESGFRIAIGFDPRWGDAKEKIYNYLQLEVSVMKADYSRDPYFQKFYPLALYTCTDDDLKQFYDVKDSQKRIFEIIKSKMMWMCFDHS